MGKLFEKVMLKIVQNHVGEADLHNAGQFGFMPITAQPSYMYKAYGLHDLKL